MLKSKNHVDPSTSSGTSPTKRKPAAASVPSILVLENPRLYLTLEEAAQYLRVSLRTMHTLKKTKQVTYTRVRDGVRFRLQWLNDYLDKRTVKAA